MTIDVDRARAETPGVSEATHLIACGSALMPQTVIDAVVAHTMLEARMGGYEAHTERAAQLDAVYDDVARLIGAGRQEIALLENATAAWCQAFYALSFKPGDRILTCEAEYAANYVAILQRVKRDGIIVDVVPSDETGSIDLEAMEALIDERVVLIAITWIPTNGGLVNPAAAVGKIAQRHGIAYLLDACQAIGQMPVDVRSIGCDFLSATGRKFLRGPRGTGFLYIREDRIGTLEPAMIDHFAAPWIETEHYQLRSDARRFENWENSYALRAGLGAAVVYALQIGLENIQDYSWSLANELREKIATLKGARLRDIGQQQCAIVSFTIDGLDPRETVATLRTGNINIGASDPDSTRIDSQRRDLPMLLRAAPHYYNCSDEIDRLVAALDKLI